MTRLALGTTAAAAAVFFLTAAPTPSQTLRHDVMVGPELLIFQDDFSSEASVAGRASGGLSWRSRLGKMQELILEPRVGLRVLDFADRTSSELVLDAAAVFASSSTNRRLRWQVELSPKLRAVSNPPDLPAYLDPGRAELSTGGSIMASVAPGWLLEARGTGGVVRYTPDQWQVLDRSGYQGSLALHRALGPGRARLTVAAGGEAYANRGVAERDDTNWSLQAQWVTGEPIFVQLDAGFAWNGSSRDGFDYRSGRAAVLISAPLGRGSAQLYSAVASKTYTNPGPPGARIAPSDRDTGSFVIAQVTQPLGDATHLHLRGEWSRSESGFRDLYFQRFGFSALLSFRSRGSTGR